MSHLLELSNPDARIFVPDGTDRSEALSRITHLGVGAHQDDLEFMAIHGILECFEKEDLWFGGVTCTNGAESARAGNYVNCSNDQMRAIRIEEQERAARLGNYGAMIQLGLSSQQIKDGNDSDGIDDLHAILRATRPRITYTHQPLDKHPTHIAVMMRLITALRRMPPDDRPEKIYGCEVWRGLDWVANDQKIALDVSGNDELTETLNRTFDSQIGSGKRYDLAVEGRKRANATFLDPHSIDSSDKIWYVLDLKPLVDDPSLSLLDFANRFLDRFVADVHGLLSDEIPREQRE